MARNEEKNYTILNRLYLAQQEQNSKEKNPERPPLGSLSTAAQVTKWIPGIKWEINFCLHQLSGVRNYPDYKIREFQERVEDLKKEYKRWVKRAIELDPDRIGIPGNPHAYHSKKEVAEVKLKKQQARQVLPNGYMSLYYNYNDIHAMQVAQAQQLQQQNINGGVEYDEGEYPAEGGYDYFAAMQSGGAGGTVAADGSTPGASSGIPAVEPTPEDDDVFETPLAVRPEGYESPSDEEEGSSLHEPVAKPVFIPPKQVFEADDPQNQPLSFSKKRPVEQTYTYTNKKAHTDELKPSTKAPEPTGLAGLADYGSDED